MILSRRVALNGQMLDELDDAIVIRSINPGTPKENITATDRLGGVGSRITGEHWQMLEMIVTYAINIPKRMLAERRAVFDMVNAWAVQKGWLTINYMENRRLYVDKVILPDVGDLWEWNGEYTITFRAYNVPFWTSETPTSVKSGTTSGGSVWIEVEGTTESVLDIDFENRSGMKINNFWVQANGNRITMANLNMGGRETLKIHHGTDGLLRIELNGSSVYEKYSGADDMYVNPGRVKVEFSADRAGILTAQSFGRWI